MAEVDGTDHPDAEVEPASPSTLSRLLHFWRSPAGQPPWARPALLCIAALAGLAYAWGMNGAYLEPFYGGAARSMSMSWHDFIFGAADPWGTVSVDKLPGALWVQALSLRIFGFHVWALVLPQVVEGVLTVLVLFRAVRRVAGAGAGIVAALVLAVSPIVVLLDRGNISDTLLILLLVLAADAAVRAAQSGRLRSLVWAGVLVGLAFQAKMLQAWLVLPALFGIYLVAAPIASFLRRVGHVALATLAVGRRVAQLDVRRLPRAPVQPALRRRQLQRLALHPGVLLQRVQPPRRAPSAARRGATGRRPTWRPQRGTRSGTASAPSASPRRGTGCCRAPSATTTPGCSCRRWWPRCGSSSCSAAGRAPTSCGPP